MARFLVVGAFVVVTLYVFAYVDLAMIDPRRVRALNKPLWALIVLLPVVGAMLWFLLGRERGSQAAGRRVVAPDDDPAFLRGLNANTDRQERIRRLEQELADLDDDPPTKD